MILRILIDECVDWRLGRELPDHHVRSVAQMGWAGVQNGRLLRLAETSFDVFLTVDRNLFFQQDISTFKIAVILLKAKTNRLCDLKSLAPAVREILPACQPGKLVTVGS